MHLASPFDLTEHTSPEELRHRLGALNRILATAPVPIAVAHDAECRFISANDALARLPGVDPDVNISLTPPPGEEPPYRIEREDRPIPADELPMQYAIAHRRHVTNDIEIVRADGTIVYVQNVELHGGRIEARSGGSGAGTQFTVRLPQIASRTERPRETRAVPDTVTSCRVLIAEDIPDAAEMMRLFVDQLGHDVRVAADGVQAVAIAREFEPPIALLDIGMPRMDGYEAARQISAALGSRVVLVALTGWGQEEDQRQAREAGFDHHLTKPADPDVMEHLIGSAARRV